MSDDLSLLVQWFESAEEASAHGRRESEQSRDYLDAKQLTETERKELRRRRQPETVVNMVRPKVEFLKGIERQSRTDPIAYPRTFAHEDEAQAATDALRYVADDQLLDMKRSQVWDNMLVEGYGALEVGVEQTRYGIGVKLTRIPWDRAFYDPHSSEPDFSDARYLGYVTWMDEAEALELWPDAKKVIETTMTNPTSSNAATYDDKPAWAAWSDSKRKRLRIVSMCYRTKGEWRWCKMTLAGFVEEPGPIQFLDEDSKPECPLIFQSAYVDRDNDRYGIIRDMIPVQDELNKRRSKSLHLSTMRQVRISAAAQQDGETIRRELARPDGIVYGEKDDFEILATNDMAVAHFNLMQDAKNDLARIGPNATLQGKSGEDQSGRAIMALQQGGMVELASLLDHLRTFNIRVFRQVWNRIRQYWTEERWVRVTDDDKGVKFVGLNTTQGALAARKLQTALKEGKIDQQTAQAYAMQLQSDPAMMQPANQVAELDIDIQIDEVQDSPTVQMEQFEQLLKMASTGMVPIPPELIIQASSLRDKPKLLEMLKQMQEAQSQQQGQPDPMQQLQIEGAVAQVDKVKSEAMRNMAQAHKLSQPEMVDGVERALEAERIRTDQFNAVTDRMQALQPEVRAA